MNELPFPRPIQTVKSGGVNNTGQVQNLKSGPSRRSGVLKGNDNNYDDDEEENQFKEIPQRGIAIPPIAEIPISKYIISRKDVTDRLDDKFKTNRACVLHGPPHSGKSVIALKYAKDLLNRGENVAWIPADSAPILLENFRNYVNWAHKSSSTSGNKFSTWTQKLSNTFSNYTISDLLAKMTHLDSKSSIRDATFIVLDNVTNFADVILFTHSHIEIGVKILVTTRIPFYEVNSDIFEFIDVFNPDEKDCVEYLRNFFTMNRRQHTDAEILRLVRGTKCNPAQVESAAKFLSSNPAMQINEYIAIQKMDDSPQMRLNIVNQSGPMSLQIFNPFVNQLSAHPSKFALATLISSLNVNAIWLDAVYECLQKTKIPVFFNKTLVSPFNQSIFNNLIIALKDMKVLYGNRVVNVDPDVCRTLHEWMRIEKLEDQCQPLADSYKQTLNSQEKLLREIELENSDVVGAIVECMSLIRLKKLNFGVKKMKIFAGGLLGNATLENLYLAWNAIDDDTVIAICKALELNKTLKTFTIGGLDVNDNGAKAVAKLIGSNTTLKNVTLASRKQIGDPGAISVAKALEKNKSLTSFTFRGLNIGDEGAQAIARAMELNKSLTAFTFNGSFGDEGTKALGKAIKVNKKLKSLILYGYNIGDEGAEAIGSAIELNKTLKSFIFFAQEMGDAGLEAIANSLKKNTTLNRLKLRGNKTTADGKKAMTNNKRENLDLKFLGDWKWADVGLEVMSDIRK